MADYGVTCSMSRSGNVFLFKHLQESFYWYYPIEFGWRICGLESNANPICHFLDAATLCVRSSGFWRAFFLAHRLSTLKNVYLRLKTLAQTKIVGTHFKPPSWLLVEIEASSDFNGPAIVEADLPVMHVGV